MLVLTCCLAIATATAAIQESRQRSPVEEALAARRAGKPERAVRLLEQWLTNHPNDLDGRLHLGFAYRDVGRIAEAEQAFRQVVALAPDYHDARIALAAIVLGRGDTGGARSWLEQVPSDIRDADAVRKQLASAAAPRWRLDADASLTRVASGQPDWREWSVQLHGPILSDLTITGRMEASRRFGRRDVFGEITIGGRLSYAVSAHVAAGGTPGADYRPTSQLGGGIVARATSGLNPTVLTLDLRRSRFRSGSVTLIQPGAQQYVLGGKAWLTGRMVTLIERGKISSGPLGRIDLQPSPGLRLFAGAARTPDTSEGIVTRVSSLFGGVEARITARRTVRLSLSRTNPETGADRTEIAVGFGTGL